MLCRLARLPGLPPHTRLRPRQFCSRSSTGGGSPAASASEGAALGNEAKKAERLWNLLVPERNWDWRHPMIPGLIAAILGLQWLIGTSESGTEQKEREEHEEVARLRAERRSTTRAAE
mmetsp:Transcript_34655/g.110080  ORF Transcript_34655/g.110080 Transcript_34655/m.110080 type:complete len:118 (-) Transcript_34655:49-402(-)